MKLSTKVLASQNTKKHRAAMWELYQRYYQLDKEIFNQRFEKIDYYALYFVENRLVGFTALKTKEIFDGRRNVMCIYTGQAVIEHEYRNKALIPRSCAYLTLKSLLQRPLRPIYVWCDSLTYKPYLAFMKATTYTFPTWRKETPDDVQAIIHELGQFYYEDSYEPMTGTVKKESNIVSDASTIITAEDRQHPDIDFYAKLNPNYLEGRGVITITKVSLGNYTHCAWRCLKKQLGIGKTQKRPSLILNTPS